MAAGKASARCAGTTLSGDRCRNTISYNPQNPGPWQNKRCGRCSGAAAAADPAPSGRDLSLGGDGHAELMSRLGSGEITRKEAMEASLRSIEDNLATSKQQGISGWETALEMEAGFEDLTKLAEPGTDDDTHVAVTLMQAFRLAARAQPAVGPSGDGADPGVVTSPSLLKAAKESNNIMVLNTAYVESKHSPETQTAIIGRLGALSRNQKGQLNPDAADAIAAHASHAAIEGRKEELANIFETVKGSGISRRVGADVVNAMAAHNRVHLADPPEQKAYLDEETARILAPYDDAAAEALEYHESAPTRHPTSLPFKQRCQRRTTSGDQCENIWTEGMDGDWCGRCAGLPSSWFDDVETRSKTDFHYKNFTGFGYVPLDDPLKEGVRLNIKTSETIGLVAQQWSPESTFKFAKPEQFNEDCLTLADIAKLPPTGVGVKSLGAGEVGFMRFANSTCLTAGTDSCRAFVFDADASVPDGLSVPIRHLEAAAGQGLLLTEVEEGDITPGGSQMLRFKFQDSAKREAIPPEGNLNLPVGTSLDTSESARHLSKFMHAVYPRTGVLREPTPSLGEAALTIRAADLRRVVADAADASRANGTAADAGLSESDMADQIMLVMDVDSGDVTAEPLAGNAAIREEFARLAKEQDSEDDPLKWPSRRMVCLNSLEVQTTLEAARKDGIGDNPDEDGTVVIGVTDRRSPVYFDTNSRISALFHPNRPQW